ncbi:putative RNA-directed DNA polymerase [Tanacetum coccineum]
MNVEALQTKYPIIDWEVYTKDSRKYRKIIRVGDHTEVELKRLFESDTDDLLELQRCMHDPLTRRLYDTCGIHHVSTETRLDIFMLVEKDYPMTRGLLMLMLVNKLQVDQHSEMAYEELNIAKDLRLPEEDYDCMKIKTYEEIWAQSKTKGRSRTEVDRNQRREASPRTGKISHFHATFCKEELEKFRLCFGKVCLVDDKTLDIAGVGDVVLKNSFGTRWTVTRGSFVVAFGNKSGSLYMVEKAIVDFYEPCVLGKQKKVRFVKSGNTRKLQGLELVHTNVYFPTSVTSIGGSLYHGTFIDDNNMKYSSREFIEYCAENRIRMLKIVLKTPQQNGVAKRMNWTLNERAKRFRISEKEWQGKEVSLAHLKVFGCDSYIKVKDVARDKLDEKSMKVTRPLEAEMSHLIRTHYMEPRLQQILHSCRAWVEFRNHSEPRWKLDTSEGSKNSGSFKDSGISYEEDSKDGEFSEEGDSETPQVRRSTKESRAQVRYSSSANYLLVTENGEPKSYSEALSSKESVQWKKVINKEISSLEKHQTWFLVRLPSRKKALQIVKMTTIKLVLSIVAVKDLHLEKLDVKTFFLHGDPDEYIYVTQPKGFQSVGKEENLVCKL